MSNCDYVSCPEGFFCTTHDVYAKDDWCPYGRIAVLEAEIKELRDLLEGPKHYFMPSDSDRDTCGKCGANFRNEIHNRF